jgi:hypothetical protein
MRPRRAFLKRAGSGILGLLGVLIPGAAWAGHRRRCSPCPPPSCETVTEQLQLVPMGPIQIVYPNANIVPGSGGFFAWGRNLAGVTINSATCGGVNGTKITECQPDAWAFRFDNVATSTNVTLTVSGTQSGVTVTASFGPFQCK